MAHSDEEQLITKSQRGDVNAFNQLVLHYQQTLFAVIFRMLGDSDSAADVTQEAFIAAFRNIHSYRGNSSFRAWLFRIGSNLACDHWRRTQRHPATSLEALTDQEDSPILSSSTGVEENPEESALTHELQAMIQQGLQQLPLDQRIAVVLRDREGFSYEEIAATTQTTLGTVRSRIARGRARMREYLNQHKELLPRQYHLTN